MEHLLWQSTTKPLRYFLVPTETEVFTGGFEIENSDNGKYSVDLDGIIEYEISEKHADQIMEKELEGLLSDFGSVLKGLAKVGKQIVNSVDDSEEEESSSEELEDGELNDILNSFLSELKEPLSELRDTIDSEFDNLEEEFENLGQKIDEEIGSDDGKAFLRELGERLIRLADEGWEKGSEEESSETDDESDDEMVTIQFTNEESSSEDVPAESKPEEAVPELEAEEDNTEIVEEQIEEVEEVSPEIPSRTALNKMKKGELLTLASSLELDLSAKNTKKELLEGIESCR